MASEKLINFLSLVSNAAQTQGKIGSRHAALSGETLMTLSTTPFQFSELYVHPWEERFPAPPSVKLKALATASNRPVPQVLSNGMIVTGAQIAIAAVDAGAAEINVIIRADLDEKPDEVKREFLNDKLAGGLTKVQRAWCLLRLAEVKRGREWPGEIPPKIRHEIQGALGVKPRHANKLIRIARTSLQIQLAHHAKEISTDLADKFCSLPLDTQKKISTSIKEQGLDTAQEIIEEHIRASSPLRAGKDSAKFKSLINGLLTHETSGARDLILSPSMMEKVDRVARYLSEINKRERVKAQVLEQVWEQVLNRTVEKVMKQHSGLP